MDNSIGGVKERENSFDELRQLKNFLQTKACPWFNYRFHCDDNDIQFELNAMFGLKFARSTSSIHHRSSAVKQTRFVTLLTSIAWMHTEIDLTSFEISRWKVLGRKQGHDGLKCIIAFSRSQIHAGNRFGNSANGNLNRRWFLPARWMPLRIFSQSIGNCLLIKKKIISFHPCRVRLLEREQPNRAFPNRLKTYFKTFPPKFSPAFHFGASILHLGEGNSAWIIRESSWLVMVWASPVVDLNEPHLNI